MRLQGVLTAVAALAVLVWVGMAVSTATILRRAEVPAGRAWLACLLAWPLVARRLHQLDAEGTARVEPDRGAGPRDPSGPEAGDEARREPPDTRDDGPDGSARA